MHVPQIDCKITGSCDILPSESAEKIQHALSNILPDSKIQIIDSTASASADSLETLERVFKTARARKSQRAYIRRMKSNLDGDSTWFYLNKQAAFADSVALCDGADESPMGPIKITIRSAKIERIIEWLASNSNQENSS